MSSKLPPMIFADDFVERHKIAWRIEQAQQDPANPLLEPKYPWDDAVVGCGHGTALKDPIDGKFKAWVPSLSEDLQYKRGETQFRLTYLESDDGLRWQRPELDVCSLAGYPKTNILMDFDSGGRATYASVFVDPEQNPDEPYEMFVFRDVFFRNKNLRVAGFSQTPGKDWLDAYEKYYGLYRYRSRDGIAWRPVEGPISLKSGDSCNVHRDPNGSYVAHHKDTLPAPAGGFVPYDVASGEVRVNFRRTSDDGTHWSERQVMMAADWYDHQADQIMEVGRYPYRDGYIGLTTIYHAYDQTMDMQFAASRDSVSWWRPLPRKPCLPNRPLGVYGGGMIWPTRTLIEHEGRLYIYYGALDALHGDLYAKDQSCMHFHGAWCRASWDLGRMWAAVSAEGGQCPGYLTAPALRAPGGKLHLNALTCPGGKIEAELLDESMKVVPGYSRDLCRPFEGDQKCAPIRWQKHATAPQKPVHLRLWITRAFLYGFEWK
jgi:hypothetical protein